jgi:nucleoside triphosphate pyrophosphatase
MRFVLASASPARLATLRRAGVVPEVLVSGVDEDGVSAGTATELVNTLAAAKAAAVAGRLRGPALVLGCDSLLEFDGQALGKPGTRAAAVARWQELRGRSGVLHTGHCLLDVGSGRAVTAVSSTTVHFVDVTDEEIELYCATGEPAGVAGAFTIDGLGGWFVTGVDGDPHTVVGLSLPLLRRLLGELGHSLPDIGYPMLPS